MSLAKTAMPTSVGLTRWAKVCKPLSINAIGKRERRRSKMRRGPLTSRLSSSFILLCCITWSILQSIPIVLGSDSGGMNQEKSCFGTAGCSCDYLRIKEPTMLPRILSTKLNDKSNSAPDELKKPFAKYSRMIMVGDSIFYIDGQAHGPSRILHRVDLTGFAKVNFTPYHKLVAATAWPVKYSLAYDIATRYQTAGVESLSYRLQVQTGHNPVHLDGHGKSVVWSDVALSLQYRQQGQGNNSKLVAEEILQSRLRESDIECGTDIYIYDIDTMLVETVPCDNRFSPRRQFQVEQQLYNTIRLVPSVRNHWVIWEEYVVTGTNNLKTGRVTSILYNRRTETAMNLAQPYRENSEIENKFSPQLTSSQTGSSTDPEITLASWLSTPHPAHLNSDATNVHFSPTFDTTGNEAHNIPEGIHVSNVSLELLQVDSHRYQVISNFSTITTGNHAEQSKHVSYLHSYLLSSRFVFVMICDTKTLVANSICVIRKCDTVDPDTGDICPYFVDLEVEENATHFNGPKSLHSAHGDSVMYWRYLEWGDREVSDLVHSASSKRDSWCSLVGHIKGGTPPGTLIPSNPGKTLIDAALYSNVAVWVDGDGEFKLLSLDKDGDGVVDVVDQFPMDGLLYTDSDNDGIGDESDIWDNGDVECSAFSPAGSCTSEKDILTVMWIANTVFVVIVITRYASKFREMYLRVFMTLESEAFGLNQQARTGLSQRYLLGSPASDTVSKTKSKNRFPKTSTARSLFKRTKRRLYEMSNRNQSVGGNQGGGGILAQLKPLRKKRTVQPIVLQAHQKRSNEMIELKKMLEGTINNEDIDSMKHVLDAKLECMTMKLVKSLRPTLSKTVNMFRWFTDTLVVGSVITAYIAMASSVDGTYMQVVWLDFFMAPIFLLDLGISYAWYEKSLATFLKEHVFMILAMWTEIPHFAYTTSPFQPMMRNLKVLKAFRVFRAYRLATHQDKLVTMMVARPERFLALFLAAFLCFCATLVSAVEWDYTATTDEELEGSFNLLTNTIWFSAVTVTTVGYGDFAPASTLGRVLSIFMMIVGIGLIGTLSAAIAKAIQTVGATQDKIKQIHVDNKSRVEQYKNVFDQASLAFNPVLNTMPIIFELAYGLVDESRDKSVVSNRFTAFRRSKKGSEFGPESVSSHDRVFPLNMDVATRLSTNPLWTSDTTMMRNYHRVPQRKKDIAQSKLVEALKDRNTLCQPRLRLQLILVSFGIDRKLGSKMSELVARLGKVIFTKPLQHDIYLERAFSIASHYNSLQSSNPKQKKAHSRTSFLLQFYQINDPIDHKLEICEVILREREYELYKRIEFPLILGEISLLILEYDRLVSAHWALENLKLRTEKRDKIPEAMLSSKATIQAVGKVVSSNPDYKQRNLREFLKVDVNGRELKDPRKVSDSTMKMANILRANKSKLMRFSKRKPDSGSSARSAVSRWINFPRRASSLMANTTKVAPVNTDEVDKTVSVEDRKLVPKKPDAEKLPEKTHKTDAIETYNEESEKQDTFNVSVNPSANNSVSTLPTKNSFHRMDTNDLVESQLAVSSRLRLSIVEQMLTDDFADDVVKEESLVSKSSLIEDIADEALRKSST